MLSVMATAQEVLDVEMPANANPLQGTINVIGIISSPNNNNNNNINNNNISNNNHNNNNNSNDNGSIIPGDLTLSTAAEAEAAAGTAAGVGAGAGAVGAVSGAGAGAGAVGPVDHSFVAIPLLERRRRSRSHSRCHITPLAPIICIQQGGGHPEDLTQLSRSVSCFVRFRRSFAKFLGKIMGSNNPSEADRYDYYDYSELEEFETPARYRPDSLSALSRATRFTEDEIKRIYRGFKAECPTGVVKEDTFKVIYSQFFPQGANPTLYAHYVFNTLDQDHSGIVSFEDFVQGLSILSRGSVEEKLRWTFSLYDINGDGFITREEMTDIVTAIYELMGRLPDECPEEEKIKGKVEHIFQKMDINRDGVVTLEEFLEACRNDDAISRSMSVFDTAF
ncbi:Kv channel-interacting protein 1 isoform X7 [Drosophila grimshawi]|uniref:Kv channel-interacting protein 1 isoform X7 n=1 Tax=Drosophila grimshawi TaxID=7222 RepID=UPI000C870C00|nr:Kv channel-interacting protein 1 isoform X7 [Drosophila grimshawi]